MRALVSAILVMSIIRLIFAQTQPPSEIVPRNTPVEIELLDNLSSETLVVGQSVPFKLVKALEADGAELLAANTLFSGTVTQVHASAHWGKAGAFDLKLEPLKLIDGILVHVDFYRPIPLSTKGEKATEAVGTALVMTYYFPLIPLALATGSRKGKPFKIRAGERYLVYVTGVDAPGAKEAAK
jgi:hypothetical protein